MSSGAAEEDGVERRRMAAETRRDRGDGKRTIAWMAAMETVGACRRRHTGGFGVELWSRRSRRKISAFTELKDCQADLDGHSDLVN